MYLSQGPGVPRAGPGLARTAGGHAVALTVSLKSLSCQAARGLRGYASYLPGTGYGCRPVGGDGRGVRGHHCQPGGSPLGEVQPSLSTPPAD